MATKKKDRTSAYYLRRLAKEHPAIYERFRSGEIKSVNAARIEAGLRRRSTPLNALKRAWTSASLADRRAFVDWAKPKKPKAVTGRDLIGPGGYLTGPAKKMIQARIAGENIKQGVLMKKLGFSHLDGSLGLALSGFRLRPAVAEAVAKWLGSPMA